MRAFAVSSIRIREVNPVLSENANHRARRLGEEAVGAIGAVGVVRRAISFAAVEAGLQLGDRLL